jgi:methylated-DNA-[protein]-cysteine S-methyltransferase
MKSMDIFHDSDCYYHVISHPVLSVAVIGIVREGNGCVVRIDPECRNRPFPGHEVDENHVSIRACCTAVYRYLDGNVVDFMSVPVHITGVSRFARHVLATAQRIPWGKHVAYSELAVRAGCPRAVRAVASVMRRNPLPLIIPCHRVVWKDGGIGRYMGSGSQESVGLKQRLLELEGIPVCDGTIVADAVNRNCKA